MTHETEYPQVRGAWYSVRFSAPPPTKNAFEQALYTFAPCVILPVTDTLMAHHHFPIVLLLCS